MFCYSKEIPKKRQKNKIIEDAKKEKKKKEVKNVIKATLQHSF